MFNRYRRVIHDRGTESWSKHYSMQGVQIADPIYYDRNFIEYRIIDRLTGSERIEREYLN